jgi:hypothetical protein
MSFTIPPILVYIASWFGMTGGVWALFDRAEKVVDPQIKEKISNWMLTAKVPVDERWPATFKNLADKVFGRKLFSMRGFFISIMFSLISITLLLAVGIYFQSDWLTEEIDTFGISSFILIYLFAASLFNFFLDYLSVVQTRFLLSRMVNKSNLINQFAFLLFDLLLTIILIWVTVLISVIFYNPEDWVIITNYIIFNSLKFKIASAPFIYSTFLTSAWIWLYVLSGVVIRLVGKFYMSLGIARKFLNIEEKPLQSIGFVSMLIVTVVYLIIPFVVDS